MRKASPRSFPDILHSTLEHTQTKQVTFANAKLSS